jgi:hypothetical protein
MKTVPEIFEFIYFNYTPAERLRQCRLFPGLAKRFILDPTPEEIQILTLKIFEED